jgi:hypothetical protein
MKHRWPFPEKKRAFCQSGSLSGKVARIDMTASKNVGRYVKAHFGNFA